MLTGDLTDFSLREILGFLASTSSSGVLELTTITQHAGVVMHEGGICVALREVDSVRGLVARMLHAGAVDAAEVRELADEGAVDAVDLAGVLARRTAGHKATAGVFREHTCETLTWLTRRDGMRFSFEASERPEAWPLSMLDHDGLFDDVEACADGWEELSDIAGDLNRVCSPVPHAPDDGIALTGEQWRVLSFVDGRRSLADLIELCGVGYLETCRQLRQLIDDGLLEVVQQGGTSQVEDLLASYDVALPVTSVIADEIEGMVARLDGGDLPGADLRVPQALQLAPAQDDEPADEPAAAYSADEADGADEADAADDDSADDADGADDESANEADEADETEADDDANRQLLRRLMSRRSAGA